MPREDFDRGKQKLGPISKQGDPYLRRILVVGALSVLRLARQSPKSILGSRSSWRDDPSRSSRSHLPTRWHRWLGRCWPKAAPIIGRLRLSLPQRPNRGRRWEVEWVCAFTNCKGDEGIDAKRSRPSIGQPVWATRGKNACFCLGPISGSHQGQRPNGRFAMEASLQRKRPYTWLHPNVSQTVRFLLHRGRRPYMTQSVVHCTATRCPVLSGVVRCWGSFCRASQ